MRWVALYALPSTLLELTYIYLRQGVLRDVCLFVCLSVSNITQKVVDEFQGIWWIFGEVRCVTSNNWFDFGGDPHLLR